MAIFIVVTDSGRSHQWSQRLVDGGLMRKRLLGALELFPQKLPITDVKRMALQYRNLTDMNITTCSG